MIESVINQYKQGDAYDTLFSSRWLPAAIAILDEPFTLDNALLNSTGKMGRAKIVDYHRDKIDYLYTSEGKNIVNLRNIEAVKRLFSFN